MVKVDHVKAALLTEFIRAKPLDNRIFDHADPAKITVNFCDTVWILMMDVFIVIEYILLSRLCQLGIEPFDTRKV